jgi:hypothetical protein
LWRYIWENQDEDARWAVKKGMPAGKCGIKKADFSNRPKRLVIPAKAGIQQFT